MPKSFLIGIAEYGERVFLILFFSKTVLLTAAHMGLYGEKYLCQVGRLARLLKVQAYK